jgi:hypothetical protein
MNQLDPLQACAQPGCPVCRISLESVQRYLGTTLTEYTNDRGVRAEIRRARGFCSEHAWRAADGRGNALAVAIVQKDVIDTALDALRQPHEGWARRVIRSFRSVLGRRAVVPVPCPACEHGREAEGIVLQALLRQLAEPGAIETLARSSGLCLVHLTRALEQADDDRTTQQLVAIARQTLAPLRDELAEFIRKNEHHAMNEEYGSERDSWLRATDLVSGVRGVR